MMDKTYTELLKRSVKDRETAGYVLKLLDLFNKGRISIDVCQAEIEALIDGAVERAGDLGSKAIKRQKKKISELERKVELYKKYAAIPAEDGKDDPNHETLRGFIFLLSVYRTVVSNTGEAWIREIARYRPEVDVFNRYDEENYSDHRKKIADVLDDRSSSVDEKKHLLNRIFDDYEKMSVVVPILHDKSAEEEVLLRNIRAYGRLMTAVFNALRDLKCSELPHSYRLYTGVVSRYFLKNIGSARQQLIWFKDRMQKVGDTEAEAFSRKTLDRNNKIGISYMLDRYNAYIDAYIKEDPDIVLCIEKVRGLVKNEKVTSDYFLIGRCPAL